VYRQHEGETGIIQRNTVRWQHSAIVARTWTTINSFISKDRGVAYAYERLRKHARKHPSISACLSTALSIVSKTQCLLYTDQQTNKKRETGR